MAGPPGASTMAFFVVVSLANIADIPCGTRLDERHCAGSKWYELMLRDTRSTSGVQIDHAVFNKIQIGNTGGFAIG